MEQMMKIALMAGLYLNKKKHQVSVVSASVSIPDTRHLVLPGLTPDTRHLFFPARHPTPET